jgi:hypothetical protein
MTTDHLDATHDEDVPVPEGVDAVVFADPTFKTARTRFGAAVGRLAAEWPTSGGQQVVLNAEDAAHAAFAAATDVRWQFGRSARPRATS